MNTVRKELLNLGYQSLGKGKCHKCQVEVEILEKNGKKEYFNLDGFMHGFSCGETVEDLGPRETGSEKDAFSKVKW